jgi:hypothetical protein
LVLHAICSHCALLLQYQRLAGEATKTVSPWRADVQAGKPDGVLAVPTTGYTFGAELADDGVPQPPQAAAPAHVTPTSNAAIFFDAPFMASSDEGATRNQARTRGL